MHDMKREKADIGDIVRIPRLNKEDVSVLISCQDKVGSGYFVYVLKESKIELNWVTDIEVFLIERDNNE